MKTKRNIIARLSKDITGSITVRRIDNSLAYFFGKERNRWYCFNIVNINSQKKQEEIEEKALSLCKWLDAKDLKNKNH